MLIFEILLLFIPFFFIILCSFNLNYNYYNLIKFFIFYFVVFLFNIFFSLIIFLIFFFKNLRYLRYFYLGFNLFRASRSFFKRLSIFFLF
jgi:hypothetical protein